MTRLHAQLSGVMPIAPTAFLPSGEVDHDSMARLYAHYVACGACGVTVLGQLG
jgi:4-hydroxy-tetrahydrodipicolinate synthase